ncbi:uncharacterized protein LOC129949902 [Eupeodes corollae]|uniref:uncharacterized protein LOC129949902 n=1 Tax=Eupeodes corollae TaxID=290404 RepID=UPI002490FEBF|nr:uncharacterized protein LOC129949902 [Eupeodes corollae]
MPHLKLISFILIHLVIKLSDSLPSNDTNSMKQISKNISSQTNNSSSNSIQNNVHSINITKNSFQAKAYDDTSDTKMIFQPYPNEGDIPESFKMGFYFFIGLSTVGILFILIKINRMRLSRAERKYGVHGDRTTQELTPLPMAIEDDSENEDHTVFDINRQIRVS